jgi:hypothetical protein
MEIEAGRRNGVNGLFKVVKKGFWKLYCGMDKVIDGQEE